MRVSLLEVHSVEKVGRGGRETRHHEVVIYGPPLAEALSCKDQDEAAGCAGKKADMLSGNGGVLPEGAVDGANVMRCKFSLNALKRRECNYLVFECVCEF